MSQFTDYFDKRYIDLKPDITPLDTLLKDDKKFLLIAGDFFGIQKFIFDQLSTRNASKVLRAKSAYIQIFTKVLTYYICDRLNIGKEYILTSNAGKFEILSPVTDLNIIKEIQEELDRFFLKNFYGLSGLGITTKECNAEDFKDPKLYRELREVLSDKIELTKFNKFDLTRQGQEMEYAQDIDNQTLCKVCNIRKIEDENCSLCNDFIFMGEKLTKSDSFTISREDGDIEIFDNYYVTFSGQKGEIVETFDISKKGKSSDNHWAISSYVKRNSQSVADFTELANSSCNNADTGIKAIGVLKGDVDSLGKYLRESDATESFENFELFSKSLNNFFSVYVPKVLMEGKYSNTYTVFAGGDDIFLIGAWDEIIKLALVIEEEFKIFVKNKLSISMGVIVTKPSTPVKYLADICEEKLEEAKEFNNGEKDAISMFNETVKWADYTHQRKTVLNIFDQYADFVNNTAFLYRLLELIKMRQNIDKNMENSMWRSKLNYSFRRNVFERIKNNTEGTKRAELFFKAIYEMIENHPNEAKMILSEFIYTRREVA